MREVGYENLYIIMRRTGHGIFRHQKIHGRWKEFCRFSKKVCRGYRRAARKMCQISPKFVLLYSVCSVYSSVQI